MGIIYALKKNLYNLREKLRDDDPLERFARKGFMGIIGECIAEVAYASRTLPKELYKDPETGLLTFAALGFLGGWIIMELLLYTPNKQEKG